MAITLQAHNFQINAIGGVLDSRNPTGTQANRPPVVDPIPAITAISGTSFSIAGYISDPDGDTVTTSRIGGSAPPGVTLQSNATVTIPAGTAAGTYTVNGRADDGRTEAAADWLARANGSGVVWAQLFETATAVDSYRFTNGVGLDRTPAAGTVGSYVRWNATDGIMGKGCLELEQLANGNMNSYWCRPFDPSLTTWQSSAPGVTKGAGQGFYVQLRMKTNCAGVAGTNGQGRKAFSVSRTENSYTFQEVVAQDTYYRGVFQMYQGYGANSTYEPLDTAMPGADFNFQPGSAYATSPGYCSYQQVGAGNRANCWTWGSSEWITYLLHVIPGNDGSSNQTVEVWAWKAGMPGYVKIIERTNLTQRYDADKSAAYNAVILWIYETNRIGGPANQKQWYDQVIFSTNFIACPTV